MQPTGFSAENVLQHFLGPIDFVIEIAVGVVIAISVVRGFIMYIKLLRKTPLERSKDEDGIKQYVGNGLILALDLAVGSDIIKSILLPTTSDILSLAVIVAIRIALSWSLSHELKVNQSGEGK